MTPTTALPTLYSTACSTLICNYIPLQEGDSALMVSAYKGHSNIVERLIKRGAEVNILNKVSALIVAEEIPHTIATHRVAVVHRLCGREQACKGSVHVYFYMT